MIKNKFNEYGSIKSKLLTHKIEAKIKMFFFTENFFIVVTNHQADLLVGLESCVAQAIIQTE